MDGLAQDYSNSSELGKESLQSYAVPSIWYVFLSGFLFVFILVIIIKHPPDRVGT